MHGEAAPVVKSEFSGKMDAGNPPKPAANREFAGVVRNGVVELLDGELPEGTEVQVRARR
jgi:hypothetical protein